MRGRALRGDYFALDDAERRRARAAARRHAPLRARERLGDARRSRRSTPRPATRRPRRRACGRARGSCEHRALPGGGFRHDAADPAGPYLGDTLAMGRAFLALYAATAERDWLARAARRRASSHARSGTGRPGFVTAASRGVELRPNATRTSPSRASRTCSSGTPARATARSERAMRYLAIPEVARRYTGGRPPRRRRARRARPRDGGRAKATPAPARSTARRCAPGAYRRIEWWDRREGRSRTRTSRIRSSTAPPPSSAPKAAARRPPSRPAISRRGRRGSPGWARLARKPRGCYARPGRES